MIGNPVDQLAVTQDFFEHAPDEQFSAFPFPSLLEVLMLVQILVSKRCHFSMRKLFHYKTEQQNISPFKKNQVSLPTAWKNFVNCNFSDIQYRCLSWILLSYMKW